MGKIILTENQLTDLIKDVVGKFTDKGKLPDMGIEDILSKATSGTKDELKNLLKKTGDYTGMKFKDFEKRTKFGKVKLVGNFTGEQKSNIKLLIDTMNRNGITDPYAQIGILSVIGKESSFLPKSEIDYSNTSNSRIRNTFGDRVPKEDSKLNTLKSNPKRFFDRVYGNMLGNGPDEGYKYRGRGFNQLTFKGNYRKYGSMAGVGIVGNPDLLNQPSVAAKVALAFFTKGKPASSFPDFDSKKNAAIYFADLNAGGSSSFRQKAIDYTDKFDVI